jgi:membrane protease YdiL (CAAX protease family)
VVLLSAPFDRGRTRSGRFPRSGLALGAGVLVLLAIGIGMERTTGAVRELGQGMARGAFQGAFLVLGWMVAARSPACLAPVFHSAAALGIASVASAFTAWGAVLYLLPPAFLVYEGARHGLLRAIGLRATASLRSLALGFAAGSFLGAHLLVSASLTFGYLVRVSSWSQYLAAVAYDVGANALAAEWLFRGALFSRLWRRWEFWPAAALSTAMAVVRYVIDPALPHAVEVRAGAVFYTALLGLTGCALRAESGSLLPGYVATVSFFAAYRLLVA